MQPIRLVDAPALHIINDRIRPGFVVPHNEIVTARRQVQLPQSRVRAILSTVVPEELERTVVLEIAELTRFDYVAAYTDARAIEQIPESALNREAVRQFSSVGGHRA